MIKKLYFTALLLIYALLPRTSNAQISVTATAGTLGPTTYTTLNAAVLAINAGTHQGAIKVSVTANTTETVQSTLNSSGTGSASYTSITIKPAIGITPTITGNISTAILELNGADNVMIDGSNTVGGTTRDLTLSNTDGSTADVAVVLWIASSSAVDGATNDTVKNCNFSGFSASSTVAGILTGGSSSIGVAATAANSNNTIQNNSFTNVQNGIYLWGLATGTYDANWNINGNSFTTLGFRGMILQNVSNFTVSNNIVNGITANTTSTPTGIFLTSALSGGNVYNNVVSNVNNTDLTWGCNGMWLSATTTASNVNVYNNYIYNIWSTTGYAASVTAVDNGYGMIIDAGAGYNVYFNTIDMITGTTAGRPSALNVTSGVTTIGAINLVNNILANNQPAGGTRYAIYCGAAANVFGTIDYNDYYSTGTLGFRGSARANLAAIITGFGGNANSINYNPAFVSTTNLDLTTAAANLVLNAGTPISTPAITTDIHGTTRSTTTPTIGAYEQVSNAITFTTLANTCSTGDVTLSGVTITSGVGVPTTGTTVPQIYFKKNALAWNHASGTLTAGTGTSGTWSFTIPAATMGGVTGGDVISYYVIAQTTGGTVFSTPSTGLVATNVNTVTTPPTTPNTYTVNAVSMTGLTASEAVCYNAGAAQTVSFPYTAVTGTANMYTLTWSPAGPVNVSTYTAIPSGTLTVTVPAGTAANTYTGTLTIENSTTLCTSVYTMSLTVNPTPGAITGGSSLCLGSGTLTLSDGLAGGTWTSTNPTAATISTGGVVTGVGTGGSTTISYTMPVTSCYAILPFTVNQTPNVNAVSNQTLCNGSPSTAINFTGSVAGTTYNWTNSDVTIGLVASGAGNIASFTATNSGTSPVVSTITVTPTTGLCTGTAETFSITVNPSTAVSPIANQSLCNGTLTSAVTFSGSVPGTTYTWTNTNTSIGLAATGAGDIASFTAVNSGTTPSVAVIVVTPSASTCTGATQTFTITVNPTPTVGAVSNQTLCNGSSSTAISFTGGVAGTTYNWTNSNATIGLPLSGTGDITSFTATNGGTTTSAGVVTVIPTTGLCTGTAETFTITVNPSSAVTVIPSQTLCNGTSSAAVNFTGAVSGTTYTWTNTNTSIGLAATGSGNIAAFTAVNSGTSPSVAMIVVTPSASSCVGTTQTFSITVNPTPTAAPVAGQTLCNGSPTAAISFSGTVAGTIYNWTNTNTTIGLAATGTGNIASFTAVNSGSVITTAVVNVTPAANGCTGAAQTFTITVDPTPTVATIANQTLCNGLTTASVNFTGPVTGTTYTWTNSNTTIGLAATGAGGIAAFTAVNTSITSSSVATIIVTPLANGCTGPSGTFIYSVNPSPYSGTVTGLSAVCAGSNITLADGTTGGVWSASNTHASVIGGLVSGNSAGLDTIIYSVTNVCGTASSTEVVTVNTLPIHYTISGGGSYCAGGAGFDLMLSGSETGVGYQLYDGAAVGSPIAGTGMVLDLGTHTSGGSYTAIGTNTVTGCSSPMTGSTTIVVNPLPHVYTVTGGGSYCAGGSGLPVGLNGSDAGVNYQLFNGSTAVGVAVPGSATGLPITFGLQVAAGTYTVLATNATTGCVNNMSGSVTISVNVLVYDSVSISTGSIDSVCVGTVVTYTATPVGGGASPSYLWTVNGFPAGTTGNTYTYTPADGDVVKCTMTSSIPCGLPASPSYSVHMTVQPWEFPAVGISSAPVFTVCAGSSVTFTPLPSFGGYDPVYSWIVNGNVAATGSTFTYDPGFHDTVSVILSSNYECRLGDSASSIRKVMIVYPLSIPSVEIIASPSMAVAFGQTVYLTALVTNGGTSPSFQWYINNVLQVGQTSNTFVSNAFTNNDSVTCTVVNSGQCAGIEAFNWVIINEYPEGVTPVTVAASDIRLFPNPNTGIFTLKGNWAVSDNADVDVQVTDMLGQVVYRGTVATQQGEMNEHITLGNTLASGVYLLNLHRGMENKVFHFVVEQ